MKQFKLSLKKMYISLLSLMLTMQTSVFADDIASSKAVTGTKKLIADATAAAAGLALISTVLIVVVCFIRKGAADEMDQKKWHTRIIIAIVCGVCATLSSALVSMVFSYYQ